MYSYKKITNQLIKKNISISVTESCTGGQLSKFLTDSPGISKVFNMGLITYSNKSKSTILGIPSKIIKNYGAVSKEVAQLMCLNLSKISKSKLCISISGIAGPSGGSKKKPVGLVYIAIKFNKKNYLYEKKFIGSRAIIQRNIVTFCLKEVNKLI